MFFCRCAILFLFAFAAASPAQLLRAPASEIPDRDRERASNFARQALDAIDHHHYVQAEQSLRDALKIIPDKATWLYNLACVLALQGRTDQAIDSLERAADAGFTDFTQLERDPYLVSLHELPRFQKLIDRKDEIRHAAAQKALADLKERLGEKYLYEADEEHKLIFAAATDQPTLDSLKKSLLNQAATQWDQLFAHKPDEFIRIIIPTAADYHKLVHVPGAGGIYMDESRTLVAQRMGQVLVHEFTHALHAADQRAMGQEHPVWLREGLASMYEAGEFVDDVLQPRDNYRLAFIQSAAKKGTLIPLEKLFKYAQQDFVTHANLAYGQSSSILLYLYEKQLLRTFYDRYKKTYSSDASGKAALEQSTGMTLPEFQKQWTQWMLPRQPPAQRLLAGGAWIGVNFNEGNDGVRVTLVHPGGPAAASGVKSGDIIVGLDNHDVRDSQTLTNVLAAQKPGDFIVLKIRRDGRYLSVPVVLGKR